MFFQFILVLMCFQKGGFSIPILPRCPFCDPNFVDVPNLQSALKGYDLPLGDPDRKPFAFLCLD